METKANRVLLTRSEAREVLGVSLSSLDQEIRTGRLRVVRIGRSVRIHPADLTSYMRGSVPAEKEEHGNQG